MEQLYIVRVNYKSGNHRYIEWCDECWYGTTPIKPMPKFTLEQARTVCEQMKNHYSYNLDIIDENEVIIEHVNWLMPKSKVNPKTDEQPKEKKKSFFSLNKGMLKNSKRFGRLKK